VFNKFIVSLMPLAPRFIVKQISKRYIAGEDTAAAMSMCADLNKKGFLTTVDILGESVRSEDQAIAARDAYLELVEKVVEHGITRNISLKPTALGLDLSEDLAFENISTIIKKAHAAGVFIRIDMENSPYTTATIEIYERLVKDYPSIGTVIQAYMHRSLDDVRAIASHKGNLRICKGIYKEAPEIAIQDPDDVRANYLKLIREMFVQGAYVGIATHDMALIDGALALIKELQVPSESYEFQALLGVPIVNRLQELIDEGHRVRIYVPFGSEWYAYSSRRLKENPDIAGYVLKNIFVSDK